MTRSLVQRVEDGPQAVASSGGVYHPISVEWVSRDAMIEADRDADSREAKPFHAWVNANRAKIKAAVARRDRA